MADPTDEIGEVGTVVGGSVYGLLGTDTQGRDLAEGLLFGLPIALAHRHRGGGREHRHRHRRWGCCPATRAGATDLVIQRAADIVNNVPLLPLLIFMVFVLGLAAVADPAGAGGVQLARA